MRYIVGTSLAIAWGIFPFMMLAAVIGLSSGWIPAGEADGPMRCVFFILLAGTMVYSPIRAGKILLPSLGVLIVLGVSLENPSDFRVFIFWTGIVVLMFLMAWRLYIIADEYKPLATQSALKPRKMPA